MGDDKERIQVAVHEVGHYIIAHSLGIECSATITYQENTWSGVTESCVKYLEQINNKIETGETLSNEDHLILQNHLQVLSAGKNAEEVFLSNGGKFREPSDPGSDAVDQNAFAEISLKVLKHKNPFENQLDYYRTNIHILNENIDRLFSLSQELESNKKLEPMK